MEPYDNPLFIFHGPIVENGMETNYVDNLGIKALLIITGKRWRN